jgi:hypothetical protein
MVEKLKMGTLLIEEGVVFQIRCRSRASPIEWLEDRQRARTVTHWIEP